MSKISIKHIKQKRETSCGAASLAMIYDYFGLNGQNETKIWHRLKTRRLNKKGEYILKTLDMARDSQKFNLHYFWGQAVMKNKKLALQPIKEFLKLSIPIVVCQKISKKNKLGHFRIVTKVKNDKIFINDPLQDKETTIKISDFINLWEDTKNGEVIGGEFFAIFKKNQLNKKAKIITSNFNSSLDYFTVTNLVFE